MDIKIFLEVRTLRNLS